MTVTNCNINPFPTSNPYTSRMYGNNNCAWNGTAFARCGQDAEVPRNVRFTMNVDSNTQELRVPDGQVVPMGCEGGILGQVMFNDDLFQCIDGTIISKSTGRIIRGSDDGNWQDSNGKIRMIKNPYSDYSKDWNDEQDSFAPWKASNENGLSKSDVEYAKMAKAESEKLQRNMNGLQKELLSELESGQLMKKPNLQ